MPTRYSQNYVKIVAENERFELPQGCPHHVSTVAA